MKTPELAYLKIKIKSLAAEAVIIRKDENRYKLASKKSHREVDRATWLGLKGHRRFDVRPEQRYALLAYGFIRGVPYRVIEGKCHEEIGIYNHHRIIDIAMRFGPNKDREKVYKAIKDWLSVPAEKLAIAAE